MFEIHRAASHPRGGGTEVRKYMLKCVEKEIHQVCKIFTRISLLCLEIYETCTLLLVEELCSAELRLEFGCRRNLFGLF